MIATFYATGGSGQAAYAFADLAFQHRLEKLS